MKLLTKDFVLNDENIVAVRDAASECFSHASGKRSNKKLILRLELAVEEFLIRFKETYGEGVDCRITVNKSPGGAITLELREYGPQADPLQTVDEENDYSYQLLQHFGEAPAYSYNVKQKANAVTFTAEQLPVKNKLMKEILAAVVLAVLTALLIRLLPEDTATLLSESVIDPVFSKLTAVISAIATPLVFFGVITGITGMGSSSAIGNTGRKLMKNMGRSYIFTAIVFPLFALLFYPVSTGSGSESGSVLKDLIQLILDIIPSNLLEGFTTDNDLQVIVIAIFLGFVLLGFGDRASKVIQTLDLFSDIVNKMMAIACKLLPLIVYLGIVRIMLSDVSSFLQLYKIVITWLLSITAIVISLLIRVKVTTHIPLKQLFSKQMATLIINLTTSSQVAALPEHMKCLKDKMGIDPKFVDYALPLGIVIYMPCGAAFLGLTCWGVASISGMTLGISAIVKLAVVAVIVAIAAPPIPGSAFAVMPIIFSACSIPMDYYTVAITCGTIIGYFLPAVNGICIQLQLLITANDLNLVDKEKLMSK